MTRDRFSASRFRSLLLISLGLFIALRLAYWFGAFPNPDEAYYWLWGKHPAFSYYDHPPLQAWLQGLSGALFGNTLFSLRLVNFLTTLGLLWLFYLYLKPLMRERTATALVLGTTLMLASPVMFAFLATAWPDNVMIFTSSLAVVFLLRFFDGYLRDGHGNTILLYLATFSLGLSAISKYNSVFVALGIILATYRNPRLRPLWRDPRLYQAIAITLLVMAPLLWWNLQHHMESFKYQLLDRTVVGGMHRSVSAFDGLVFFLILVFTLSPFVSWLLYRLLGQRKSLYSEFAGKEHYLHTPLWIFTVSTATFLFFSLFDPMLYYWDIIAYPFLFPLLAVFLFSFGKSQKATIGHIAYGLLFAIAMVFQTLINPISAYVNKTSDQDSRMLYGWGQLAPVIKTEYEKLQKEYPRIVLIATDYRKASALAFTTGIKNVVCVSKRRSEFDYWQRGKVYGDKTALILSDDWHPINAQLRQMYASIKTVATLDIRHHGRFIKRYYLAVGRNPPNGLIHRKRTPQESPELL